MKHPLRRALLFTGMALFAVLWPPTYGLHSHSVWARLGWALAGVVRAAFIGYATAFLIFRPMLTTVKPGQTPLFSVWHALRLTWAVMRKRPLPELGVSTPPGEGQHR